MYRGLMDELSQNDPTDLLPKPFKDTDNLLKGVLEAAKTYGALNYPGSVCRVTFTISQSPIGSEHCWTLETKLEGYGTLTPEDETTPALADEAQKLENLTPTPILTKTWVNTGETLDKALEELRKRMIFLLESVVRTKESEKGTAEYALKQIRAGTQELWGDDPAQAEVAMEAIVENSRAD